MPQPRTLNVEKEELIARAGELQSPIPDLPKNGFTDYPEAPCALDMITGAASTMRLSARTMVSYLQTGETYQQHLAEQLLNAAKYYADTDGGAAEAIANETSVSVAAPGRADVDAAMLMDTPVAPHRAARRRPCADQIAVRHRVQPALVVVPADGRQYCVEP
jgi:hypothetical protein